MLPQFIIYSSSSKFSSGYASGLCTRKKTERLDSGEINYNDKLTTIMITKRKEFIHAVETRTF